MNDECTQGEGRAREDSGFCTTPQSNGIYLLVQHSSGQFLHCHTSAALISLLRQWRWVPVRCGWVSVGGWCLGGGPRLSSEGSESSFYVPPQRSDPAPVRRRSWAGLWRGGGCSVELDERDGGQFLAELLQHDNPLKQCHMINAEETQSITSHNVFHFTGCVAQVNVCAN